MHFATSNVLMHNFYKINVLNYTTQPTYQPYLAMLLLTNITLFTVCFTILYHFTAGVVDTVKLNNTKSYFLLIYWLELPEFIGQL